MADDRIAGYAAGIFEIARGEGVAARVESELFAVARAFESNPELRSTLSDPRLPLERKHGIIDDLLETRADDLTVALVSFLADIGRVGDLGEISAALSDHAAATTNRETAVVRSAIPLDEATVERLARALGKATGKVVDVRVVVDPSVMGGIVATVGDTVIDGTVRSKLEQMRSVLTTRS
ncbi:MAG: ATP synthase F1 subunit delta [Acidimicrobiia bacterium]